MQHTHDTLSANFRVKSVELLNKHLAAAIDLHGQVKQHWNVHGPAFIAVHELFDKVADTVEDYSDTLAEQVATEHSFLAPYALGIGDEKEHITTLSISLATFGESARKAIDEVSGYGDADTADLLTEISRGIDRQLWFVE